MKKNNFKKICSLILLTIILLGMSSCSLIKKFTGTSDVIDPKPPVVVDPPVEETKYVTINYNFIRHSNVMTEKYNIGDLFTLLIPSEYGYNFLGWYLDMSFTDGPYTTYVSNTETIINFYALWEDIEATDQKSADSVNTKIALISVNVTLNDETLINSIVTEYSTLNDNAKSKVVNYQKVTAALETIKELKIQAANEALAMPVVNEINAIPSEVNLDAESQIIAANNMYLALSSEVKLYVINYKTLLDAIGTIKELKQDVQDVIALISKIDKLNISKEQEPIINEANEAYKALPEISKKYVTNAYDVEYALATLKAQEKARENATIVITLINELPSDIDLTYEEQINKIRAIYNNVLTEYGKTLVSNYSILVKAEERVTYLKNEDLNRVNDAIAALPNIITYNDNARVEEIMDWINALTQEQRDKIKDIDKWDRVLQALNDIEQNTSMIEYVLGDNHYKSKQALFESFFTDFYYFIVNTYGAQTLENYGLYNADHFMGRALDNTKWPSNNRDGIGMIGGKYLLSRDVNGISADQPATTFIGFCNKHNIYQDIIPFFINFFAYWRIDERYANTSNYGADFFVDAWATLTDIAKFFYYNEDTSYVKSERMIDCLTNTAGVVYGDFGQRFVNHTIQLTMDYKLRGYTFGGWYDNPDFTGDPITEATFDVSKKVIVYAKWIKDQAQFDLDQANLVDIYIYNLTTKPANCTDKTITNVREMYNNLSDNAKKKVTNYNTLIQLEESHLTELINQKTITIHLNKTSYYSSFEIMKQDFLTDFNNTTGTNVKDYSTFTTNRYTLMSKISAFYNNNEMYTKWAFILEYILNTQGISNGLRIQTTRVMNKQAGDAEYVAKAIDGFFSQTNLYSDTELLINLANTEKVCAEAYQEEYQDIITLTYTKEASLPTLVMEGFIFKGFTSNPEFNGVVYKQVSDDTPTILYAYFSAN